uniref:Protein YIPF n=1 Tax=Athene cunicularia TaxID=194338 RepID=A0A663LKK1_ATHCN
MLVHQNKSTSGLKCPQLSYSHIPFLYKIEGIAKNKRTDEKWSLCSLTGGRRSRLLFCHLLQACKNSVADCECLHLSVAYDRMLQGGSADSKDDGGPQFAEVFVIIWFGAVVITLNSKLLGGTISFFQSLCVLGYCVLPLTVAMLVCRLVLLAGSGTVSFVIRLIVVVAMFGWSTLASTAFLADSQPPNRKALVVYPIFLFYFVISWMILTFTPQ